MYLWIYKAYTQEFNCNFGAGDEKNGREWEIAA